MNAAANVKHTKDGPMLTMRQRQLPGKVIMTILLVGFAVLMIVPFIWMVSSSFKAEREEVPICVPYSRCSGMSR